MESTAAPYKIQNKRITWLFYNGIFQLNYYSFYKKSSTLLGWDESLSDFKCHVCSSHHNNVVDGFPSVCRQSLGRRNKVASCVVYDDVRQAQFVDAIRNYRHHVMWVSDVTHERKNLSGRTYNDLQLVSTKSFHERAQCNKKLWLITLLPVFAEISCAVLVRTSIFLEGIK